jgi:hypothetical protein
MQAGANVATRRCRMIGELNMIENKMEKVPSVSA